VYQEINGIGKSVTIDELRDLVEQQIFVRIGETVSAKMIVTKWHLPLL